MRTAGARGSGGNFRVLRRDRDDVLLGHVMERARFWQPDAENTALDTGEPLDYQSAPVTTQRGPLHSSMTVERRQAHLVRQQLADRGHDARMIDPAGYDAVRSRA